MSSASSVASSNAHPAISLFVIIGETFALVILYLDTDSFRTWTAWICVVAGLFINYVVNRKKFHEGMRELWREFRQR